MPTNLSALLKRWGPLALNVVVIVALVHFIDIRATVDAFGDLDALPVALSAVLFLLDRASMSYKWNVLLKVRGAGLSHISAFRVYLASGFIGYILPSSLGSDIYRAARLSVDGRRVSNVSATIVVERVLGMLAILSLSCAALLWLVLTERKDLAPLLGAVASALGVGVVLTLISISNGPYALFRRITRRVAGNKIVRMLYALHDEYISLSKGVRSLVAFYFLSLLNQVIQSLMFVPILVSLDVPVEWMTLFAVLPLNKAMVQLLPSPAAIGVGEGSIVVALSLAHVPPAQGLVVALVLRAIDLCMLAPAGIAYAADAWLLRRDARSTSQAQ
jgi:glycosyltransferase 2 family protein